MRATGVFLALGAAIAVPAARSSTEPVIAPTPLNGGKECFTWTGTAGQVVAFKNNTGLKIHDMWFTIGNDLVNNPPELGVIEVEDSGAGTKTWDVDDEEDGNNEGVLDNDATDSSPQGDPKGLHRAQARGNADGFDEGETFSIALTDENGGSVKGRVICLWPTKKKKGETGGDNGVLIAAPLLAVSSSAPCKDVPVTNAEVSAFPSLAFGVAVANVGTVPISAVTVLALQNDVNILAVESDGGGTWNAATDTFTFQVAIAPGTSRNIDYDLSGLTSQGSDTTVRVCAVFGAGSVPTLPEGVLTGLALVVAAAGAWILARRRAA